MAAMYGLPKRPMYFSVSLIVCMSFYPTKDSFPKRKPYSWNIGIGIGLNLTRIEIVDQCYNEIFEGQHSEVNCSRQPKIHELHLFISGIQSKVGLFTLSKTRLTQEIAYVELGIEGYTFHRRDGGYKERGGGLGIYVIGMIC